ncbi:hypothetical protein ASE63_04270 [Bosea sp. Root381]|uniref:alpha/beta fold hydrolase n=1 Tax=Bosea sp. Root381 TaxID=1736524 RepID=UPI0006FE31FB|nr:alpha/beta hydrolase [Bosea sp. Root381]KRE09748.1 hypothetical protein ASE63_04270 [Bosea sp. Root381]
MAATPEPSTKSPPQLKRGMVIRWLFAAAVVAMAGLLFWSEWLGAQAARRYPPLGSFVAVAGGRLHYRESRPATEPRGTVVLIHGASAGHADLLATLGPELGHYRVIAIDRPGQGWSDRLAGDAMADPGRQAEVLMQALDAVAPEHVVLVAHSLAGAAAGRIALERPERLRGLVLLGAITHPWDGRIGWYQRVAAWPLLGPVFVRLVGVPAASLLLEKGAERAFAPRPMPRGYLETGEVALTLRPASFRANSRDVAVANAFVAAQAPHYGELKVPVVAITGDSDTIVSPMNHSAAIARQAPQGRFVLLPGVGHMPHHAAPEIIVEAIDQMVGPRSGLALN